MLETPGRIPNGHLGRNVNHLGARVVFEDAADAFLEVRRVKPGTDARAGGDGLPNFLSSAGDFSLDLNRAATRLIVFDAHATSLAGVS